jgi:hypothetical protein
MAWWSWRMREGDDVPPAITAADGGDDTRWPIYFARQALTAANLELQVGQQFEHQNKPYIRGLAEAYGVERADQRPFHTLSRYVGVLMVPRRLYAEIRERKLSYRDAAARLARVRSAQGEVPHAEL